MIDEPWFSAMLRMVVLVEGSGAAERHRTLILIRALDYEEAFNRALERGRELERRYLNGLGEQVSWRLEAVETIDELDEQIEHGREVYSETSAQFSEAVVPAVFHPESSRPHQTGV